MLNLRFSLLTILILLPISAYSQQFNNSVGGQYASQVNAAVARDQSETSIFTNPAGLANFKGNSISSGASSYGLLRVEDESNGNSYTALSSSSNHVALVIAGSKYNYGFMIYNFSTTKQFESKNVSTKNSEDYLRYNDSITTQDGDAHLYSFALARKNSKQGFNFNLINFDNRSQVSTSGYEYSQATPGSRRNFNTSTIVQLKLLAASVNYGFQGKFSQNFKWGLKLTSPAFILQNNSHVNVNMLYITPNGANDNYILNIRQDSEYTISDNKFNNGDLIFGLAYLKSNIDYELDFLITPASKSIYLKQKSSPFSSTWNSSTDTNTSQTTFDDSNTRVNSKATIETRLGAQYRVDDKNTYGLGFSYTPTKDLDDKGVNTATLTIGTTKSYKNFIGNYALHYMRGFDAGNNEVTDSEGNNTEDINISYEQYSLIFGGSYQF